MQETQEPKGVPTDLHPTTLTSDNEVDDTPGGQDKDCDILHCASEWNPKIEDKVKASDKEEGFWEKLAQQGLWKYQYGETPKGKVIVVAKMSGKPRSHNWNEGKYQGRQSGVRVVGLQTVDQQGGRRIKWKKCFDENAPGEVAEYSNYLRTKKRPGDSEQFKQGFKDGKPCFPGQIQNRDN